MTPAEWDETERTYDVGGATVLPDLVGVHAVARVGPAGRAGPRSALLRHRRAGPRPAPRDPAQATGGDDGGWNLKLPQGGDTRTELRQPLGPATRTVPPALLPPVRSRVRDRELAPIARLSTRRLEYALIGEGDVVLAHVCDDQVARRATPRRPAVGEWREWEVELGDEGDVELVDAVEEALSGAGAALRPRGPS